MQTVAAATRDEIEVLLHVLPPPLQAAIHDMDQIDSLIEIVMDFGRQPEARTFDQQTVFANLEVTEADLAHVVAQIGDFGDDNRAGITRTLHRISAIRNRKGKVIGLTLRVGRAVYGTVEIVRDVIESGQSVLLLGRPGVGKTTMLREAARILAEDSRVVIVDTSNEIAGDGDIPHPAIGRARRMQVATPTLQHEVMIEAVENHNPQAIVIDEIGRELEALAARTIAERGVQLIGTAHGNALDNLLMNPTLSDLIGGIESVTLSDEEARRRGTQKTVLERRAPPTFDVLVEIQAWQRLAIHHDVAAAVDAMLRGRPLAPEMRFANAEGEVVIERGTPPPAQSGLSLDAGRSGRESGRDGQGHWSFDAGGSSASSAWPGAAGRGFAGGGAGGGGGGGGAGIGVGVGGSAAGGFGRFDVERVSGMAHSGEGARALRVPAVKVFAYGVSQNRLRQSAKGLGVPLMLTEDIAEAGAMMTLKSYYRKRPAVVGDAEARGIPIYVLRSNTFTQMESALIDMFGITGRADALSSALREVDEAIRMVQGGVRPMVELGPQAAHIRRQQHERAREANVLSLSRGKEPNRRVRIFTGEGNHNGQ